MRWQLNDLARRLDKQPAAGALTEGGVAAPPASSGSGLTPDARRMLEAIESLPEDEREVFDLIRIQGLTYPEAAAVIDTSVATVQRRLSRGRLRLAQQLADLHPGPSGGPIEPPGDAHSRKPGPPCRRSPSGETFGLPRDTLPP
jgi:RNA polymerase sigma-70 factor (ECF subfamily)